MAASAKPRSIALSDFGGMLMRSARFGDDEMSKDKDVHRSSNKIAWAILGLFAVQIAVSMGCPGPTQTGQTANPEREPPASLETAGVSSPSQQGTTKEPIQEVTEANEIPLTQSSSSPVDSLGAAPDETLYEGWSKPEIALFVSGRQHGYIEPCGCTGLANQKGGLLRRHTCLEELRAKGWDVIPLDLGNQVRRFGAQASIKFTRTVEALTGVMQYQAIGLGPDDLKLPSTDLIQAIVNSSEDDHVFTSANVDLFGGFVPKVQIVERNGQTLGITSVLGAKSAADIRNDDAEILAPVPSLRTALDEMSESDCDLRVLLAFASIDETREMIQSCPQFDLAITAGVDGEPTLHPEWIDVGERKVPMIQVGVKGMYVGVVGWFPGTEEPLRYQRVPLDARFEDSEDLKQVFQDYQSQLRTLGLAGLEVSPVSHPTGNSYVGSEACSDCHSTAYDIWKHGNDGQGGPHFNATESLVRPGERTWVQRHFDPECLSCHVTGWNPQRYYPYQGGYLDLEKSAMLHGNGCENCHGPGSRHVAAENGDLDVTADELVTLQQSMKVELDATQCMECHDLDNSPDFHVDGAFEKYWARIIHEGKD